MEGLVFQENDAAECSSIVIYQRRLYCTPRQFKLEAVGKLFTSDFDESQANKTNISEGRRSRLN